MRVALDPVGRSIAPRPAAGVHDATGCRDDHRCALAASPVARSRCACWRVHAASPNRRPPTSRPSRRPQATQLRDAIQAPIEKAKAVEEPGAGSGGPAARGDRRAGGVGARPGAIQRRGDPIAPGCAPSRRRSELTRQNPQKQYASAFTGAPRRAASRCSRKRRSSSACGNGFAPAGRVRSPESLQPRAADAAFGEAGEEALERRRRLLDVTHALARPACRAWRARRRR